MAGKFLVLLLILCVTSASAEFWNSPIDQKYREKSPELFESYDAARILINSYTGRREDLQKAYIMLEVILAKDEQFAPVHREYGRLHLMSGYINYDNYREESLLAAEKSVKRALEIEPHYADAYVLLASVYIAMKEFGYADLSLTSAERIGTESPWLEINWARLLDIQGKYSEALERYQNVIEKGTNNEKAYAGALEGITSTYWKMGDYDSTDTAYRNQLENNPNSAWIWGNYANFLLFTYQDIDGAIEYAEEALTRMNYGGARFTLGCALFVKWAKLLESSPNKEEAQEYFDRAWAVYPYPEKVLAKTVNHEHLKVLVLPLNNWMLNNGY